jgi:putative transcriptional regulator
LTRQAPSIRSPDDTLGGWVGTQRRRTIMRRMTGKQLKASEARRDIGAELLQAALQIRSGNATRLHRINVPAIIEARIRAGLSRQQFATVLGVSPATLARWESGQRKPTRAARSLLKLAKHRPDVFRDVFTGRGDGFGQRFVCRKGKIPRSTDLEF